MSQGAGSGAEAEPLPAGGVADPEFAEWMGPLGPWGARRVAVAVSGGADSLALAWLASRWGEAVGFVVDHGLRADSAAEAELVAGWLRGFRVSAQVLRLGLGPGPGVAARAREARYAALGAAVAGAGLCDLLVGHQALDQAETFLIRAASGSGEAGLAGMARVVETGWGRIVRPLLGVAPGRLRATLAAAGLDWIEDPTNRDARWTRARVRAGLGREAGAAAAAAARRAGAARAEAEGTLAAALGEQVAFRPEGFAIVRGAIGAAGWGAVVRTVAGAAYPARSGALARLAARARPGTLGGVRVMPAGRLGEGWLVVREAAAVAGRIPAAAGVVWDRRFRLVGEVGEGLELGAAGAAAAAVRRRHGLPGAVAAVLPGLWRGRALVAVPHLGYAAEPGLDLARLVFVPAIPAAGAGFFV